MQWLNKVKHQAGDYIIDHPRTKRWLTWAWKFFITVTSCFLFAWGFRAFVNPNVTLAAEFAIRSNSSQFASVHFDPNTMNYADAIAKGMNYIQIHGVTHFVSGGASGTSQVIIKFAEIFPGDVSVWVMNNDKLLISILYFALNIPLVILSWFKISKQFTIFTLINVIFVSLFQTIIPDSWIYNVVNLYDDMLARAIFGGICTGIASGAAMMIGTSAGGTDVISFFIAEKKGSAAGKFSFIINGTIIATYVLFAAISHSTNEIVNPQENNETIRYMLYTFIYLFVSVHVLDFLNTKNKKQELQIFTDVPDLATVMIRAFPHSATIIEGKGAYTGKKKTVIYMVISRSEAKRAVKVSKSVDPYSFIAITDLKQVYGRFYIKPIDE